MRKILQTVLIILSLMSVTVAYGEIPRRAVCRIYVKCPNGITDIGSGTVINNAGLIVTCQHLFDCRRGQILVRFEGLPQTWEARLLKIAPKADLAAIQITSPPATAIVGEGTTGNLTIAGYGEGAYGKGILMVQTGRVLGESKSNGVPSSFMSVRARHGDSGGGVFDTSGRLVGVLWGSRADAQNGSETYFTTGHTLRDFLTPFNIGSRR